MTDFLSPTVTLLSILVVSTLTLATAIRTLLSSRRSERIGEDRYELLRDNWDRLEMLREERRMLTEELERQSRERQQLTELLGNTPAQLVENLKKERAEHLEANRRIEDLEQKRLPLEQELNQLKEQLNRERLEHLESQRRTEQLEQQQNEQVSTQREMERLRQEQQRLTEELKKEHEERLEVQRRAEQHEQERMRIERESRALRAELDSHRRAPTRDQVKEPVPSPPRWRRPVFVVGLLLGALLLWFTSLVVALYLISP